MLALDGNAVAEGKKDEIPSKETDGEQSAPVYS